MSTTVDILCFNQQLQNELFKAIYDLHFETPIYRYINICMHDNYIGTYILQIT